MAECGKIRNLAGVEYGLLYRSWCKFRTKIRKQSWFYFFERTVQAMEVKSVMGHYEIYKDGEFVCSCDAGELSEILADEDEM